MHALLTGLGVVSPYGVGRDLFWREVAAGRQAFRPLTRFDASAYRNTLAGEVPDFPAGPYQRAAAFAATAAREAVADANLPPDARLGLVLGTNFAGLGRAEAAFRSPADPAAAKLDEYLAEHALAAIAAELGRPADSFSPRAALCLSCASGAAALGQGLDWLRSGRCDAVLAGGFDELTESAYAGLSALRAVSRDTIRPFDVNRDGPLFSEGAGLVVLETPDFARARGARAYARLLGRGLNNDAFHMTAPDQTGKGIAAVMRMALKDAGLEPEKIAHLNLHGTATKYNDQIETLAIKTVFGEHCANMTFTANKSLFGHAMGAAGALEAIVTCLSLTHGLVPPTIGCRERDPELDLDCCFDSPRAQKIELAMTNSYGLGGTNASLVLGRAD